MTDKPYSSTGQEDKGPGRSILDHSDNWQSLKIATDQLVPDMEAMSKAIDTVIKEKKKEQPTIPAIPPTDYKGSQSKWMSELRSRNLWDGNGWYGDIEIPDSEWWAILEECEK